MFHPFFVNKCTDILSSCILFIHSFYISRGEIISTKTLVPTKIILLISMSIYNSIS